MIVTETSPAAVNPVPLDEFAAHLRLAQGFADDAAEDGLLELYLRNATSVVEARVGKALIRRGFKLQVTAWSRDGRQLYFVRGNSIFVVDVGIDGVPDELEEGFDPITNPDPHGDGSIGTPGSSEGDGIFQEGEGLADRGQRLILNPRFSVPLRLGGVAELRSEPFGA